MTGPAFDANVSPCTGICRLDPGTGYCEGCGRTGNEVAEWAQASGPRREQIWRALPGRLVELERTTGRLPCNTAQIADFIERTIHRAEGAWLLGVHGAVGEFLRDADEPLAWSRTGGLVEAVTPRAALRLELDSRVLALGSPEDARSDRLGPIVLAVPHSAFRLPVAGALTALGRDREAIRPQAAEAHLFDVGIGRDAARFCIRTDDPALIDRLVAAQGCDWPAYMRDVTPAVVASGPARVIETGLGRVEIDTPVPPPDGRSPEGPHTHLLPDHLALGRDAPPGIDLPPGYAPGAIFYPRRQ